MKPATCPSFIVAALLLSCWTSSPATAQIRLDCPANQAVATCGAGTAFTYLASATSSCPGCVTISCSPTNGSFLPLGTNLITCSALDNCGAATNCSFLITVQRDTIPPLMLCSTNRSVECGTPWSFNVPRAIDVCDGSNLTIRVVGTITNVGGCPAKFLATRTWQAIDSLSNSILCSQTITVVDTAPPVLVCGRNQTVECGVPWSFTLPVAVDNCDGTNVNIQILSTVTNSLCGRTYTATRFWRATDSCGSNSICSQMVTVVDTTPPVMTCVGAKAVECGSAWTFDRPSANDLCDGTNVTINIVSTATNTVGFCGRNFTVTRTWRAFDACSGTNAQCSQTVTVVDTFSPFIFCPARVVAFAPGANGIPVSFAPAALDGCNGTNLTILCQPASGSVFPTGTNRVTCRAIDPCNNTNQCSFDVIVLPPPDLSISVSAPGSIAGLSWSALYADYLPESTAAIAETNHWRLLTNQPMAANGRARVELPGTNGPAFYRLRRVP